MRNLLLAFTLLVSSVALAAETPVVITGLSLKEGNMVVVRLDADPVVINAFSLKEDLNEDDELVLETKDIRPGTYGLSVLVRESSLGSVIFRRFTQVEIK